MDYDYLFKLVLTGCSSVGKTSLLHRFMDDEFLAIGIPTIGVDFRIKQFLIGGDKVKLQIWDSAGQERFQSLTRQYYRNANALCIVYDITDFSSFERSAEWLEEFRLYGSDSAPRYLIGNKTDLEIKRQVPRDVAQAFADKHGMTFSETSAKSGHMVLGMFNGIAEALLAKAKANQLQPLQYRQQQEQPQQRQAGLQSQRVRLGNKLQHSISCCN